MDEQNLIIHTMDYYSTIKRDAVQIHAIKRVILKNITLSERSQSQRPFIVVPLM